MITVAAVLIVVVSIAAIVISHFWAKAWNNWKKW